MDREKKQNERKRVREKHCFAVDKKRNIQFSFGFFYENVYKFKCFVDFGVQENGNVIIAVLQTPNGESILLASG